LFYPKEDVEFSKGYFDLFRERDFEAIEARVDPGLRNPQLRSELEKIAAVIPREEPVEIQVADARTVMGGGVIRVHVTLQYAYPEQWLLLSIGLLKQGGDTFVTGIHAQTLPNSLEYVNRFTFEGKGVLHYVIFVSSIIVPLLIIAAVVLCIRTPVPKRKWLWILFILMGVVRFKLNWTDGNLSIIPGLQLLGAGYVRIGLLGPWFLSASLPIGAIAFLLRRRKWLAQANAGP
jgi:hypothetical protein